MNSGERAGEPWNRLGVLLYIHLQKEEDTCETCKELLKSKLKSRRIIGFTQFFHRSKNFLFKDAWEKTDREFTVWHQSEDSLSEFHQSKLITTSVELHHMKGMQLFIVDQDLLFWCLKSAHRLRISLRPTVRILNCVRAKEFEDSKGSCITASWWCDNLVIINIFIREEWWSKEGQMSYQIEAWCISLSWSWKFSFGVEASHTSCSWCILFVVKHSHWM